MSGAKWKSVKSRWLKLVSQAISFGVLLVILTSGSLRAEMSQVPLFLTVEVTPNIVFVIDDSGSMHFETLPDEMSLNAFGGSWPARGVFYMFPAAECIYGASSTTCDYWRSSSYVAASRHNVPRFDANNRWAAYFRSHHNNKMYYNPQTRYRPWVESDGTPWPEANPTAAYHNPASPAKGSRNLTVNNSQSACWINDNVTWVAGTTSTTSLCGTALTESFYPATYFSYKGGDIQTAANYSRIEIKSANAPFAGGPNRTDCADSNACTYDEEIQNFANWYSYHRSRILTARGGIGRAFAAQGTDIRVGYGTINAGALANFDGQSSPGTMVRGVRDFLGTDRDQFFSLLYNREIPLAGTPLRRALDDVGQYYMREDNRGPWSTTPGSLGGENLACRNSYTVLMTDGYWNIGTDFEARHSTRRANVDNTTGSIIPNPIPGATNYRYIPAAPYRDDWSNTLADVAMFYWNRDLCPNIPNKVPTSPFNEAYWQSMVTFGVGLGVSGTLDPETDLAALKAGTLAWPDPTSSDAARLDDLWHAALNSRGDFFSAMDPEIFSQKLGDILAALVDRKTGTAAAIATNSTRLIDNTLIYQARFDSEDWSGQIIAYRINSDGSIGDVAWNTDTAGKVPTPGDRTIYTWNGSSGVALSEGSWGDLSAAQRAALQDGGSEEQGKDRLNWLRGDRSKEQGQTGGYLRARNNVLGDIVNSDPLVVGAPNFRYEDLPAGTPGKDSYTAFRIDNGSRPRMLYIGGNDGMLHAFDANTGVEKFAFVPNGVFHNLADLTSPDYTHRYYVDGSPNVGDAYWDGTWKTLLVGSLGAGGRSIFALDVTDPDNFDQSKVLWEFSHPDLGFNLGQPAVARLMNGQWAVIFSNGYRSDTHKAQLFILNAQTGALIRKIDTAVGTALAPNGLSAPALLANAGRTIEYAYAGDLQGNLWKFDLTHASNVGQWDVAFKDGVTPRPLFTARNAANQIQRITAPLEIGKHPSGGVMIYFGTGKYFEVGDNLVGANPPIQSFYGIRDTGTRITVTNRSTLVSQTILAEGLLHPSSNDLLRAVSSNAVDYNTMRGWYLDLVSPVNGGQGERVVSSPLLRRGRIIFTSLIPLADPCAAGGTSWLMELDAIGGARLDYSVFDVNDDTYIDNQDYVTITINGETLTIAVSGVQSNVGIIKTPAVIEAGELEYKYFGGSEGGIAVLREKGGDSDDFGRRSWRQLR